MLQLDIKKLLALATMAGFFIIIGALFFIPIPPDNLDLAKTLVITLIAIVSAVAGYYFGSSDGSARKTELMSPPAPLTGETALTPSLNKVPDAGFIRLPLLIASLLLGASLLVAGCATTSPTAAPAANDSAQVLAGKSLLAVKSTILVAATSADTLCKNGTLKPDVCTQAKAAYEQSKPAYDAAVDAYLLMSSKGGDPGAFGRALTRVQSIAANLVQLTGGSTPLTDRGAK